jgi:hypothetical protein
MFFSKIWFVLLAVLAALACGVALVASKPAVREVNQAKAESLDRIQHNADLLLRLQARDWIDAAAGMSRDRVLVESLERASDRKGDLKVLNQKVSGRLLSLTSGLKAQRRPELMIVTDARGKQLTRVGEGEERADAGKVGLAGYPLVEAALRGYRRDDTWNINGKLYLMVGSPVISRGRGRYVGTLLLGRAIDKGFAKRLKGSLGEVDVVFYLRGSIVATTISNSGLTNLPQRFSKQRKQIIKDGRSTPLQINSGKSMQGVIMAPLPGEARAHDAFYAIVGKPDKPLGLALLLDRVQDEDVAWGSFPWLLFIGGLVVVLVVGLALMIWEADMPAKRLLKRMEELAKGEASRLNDRQFSGKFGSMARAVNSSLDRAEKRTPASSTKDLNKILGSPAEQGTRPELRMDPSFSSMPPLAAPGVKALEDIGADGKSASAKALEVEVVPSASKSKDASFGDIGEMMGRTLDLEPDPEDAATEIQATPPMFSPREAAGALKPPVSLAGDEPTPVKALAIEKLEPLSTSGAASSFSLEPSVMPGAGDEPEESASKRKIKIPESEQILLPPAHSTLPPLAGEAARLAQKEAASVQSRATAPALPAVSAALAASEGADPDKDEKKETKDEGAGPDGEDLKGYFQQIYNSFVSVKQQCGENIDNLTLDRFEAKLKQNRQNLIKRYDCKSVKFQVYIKDGKAAIKATPIKD